MSKGMICEYCGAKREQVYFCIGASRKPDWVMNEGTGKISCPDCFEIARAEGSKAIDKHVANHNARCKR